MSSKHEEAIVRIDLTDDQRAKVKQRTGKDADAIELTVEELEARIAPRLGANHNESMLADDVE